VLPYSGHSIPTMGRWGFLRLPLLIGLSLCANPAQATERTAPCAVAAAQAAHIATVIDERTFRLGDGTEVRLAGLEGLRHTGDRTWAETAAARVKAGLERLLRGKAVAVEHLGEDRYGRRIALAAVEGAREGASLQERLLAQGLGLVSGSGGHPGCMPRLLATERTARAAGLGLWADPQYLVRDASRPAALTEIRGRFALVEGRVVSVNDRGATVYVNFGRRWSQDFTVTIAKRNVHSFTAAGLDPQRLAGRRLRIRGWVDERGGPWIEASRPEQIEFANRH
jgi:endonuclease YncB( thermonuclease family)